MSGRRFASAAARLREAAADAAWIQWQALGGQAAVRRAPASIVDPEALVLFSLWMRDDEPRLVDFLYGFAELGSRMLSVQRLRRVMTTFPADAPARVASFAAAVRHFGKDPRWTRLAGEQRAKPGRPGKSTSPTVRLSEPPALMLRLRTAFGVDVRTDVLAYLIGRRESWASVREIAAALGYAKFSVRNACEALAAARFVTAGEERPVTYYADAGRWRPFLGLSEAPPWQPWISVYALVLRLLAWFRTEGARPMSDSLMSSLARDVIEADAGVLKQLQLAVPVPRDHLGEAYLPAFERTVTVLADWLRRNA